MIADTLLRISVIQMNSQSMKMEVLSKYFLENVSYYVLSEDEERNEVKHQAEIAPREPSVLKTVMSER